MARIQLPRVGMLFHYLTLVGVALFLSGCAITPRIDTAPEKLSAVRSIAIIRPIEPATYTVYGMGSAWSAFGLIGTTIGEIRRANQEQSLTIALKAQGVSITKQLADGVASNLSGFGFETYVENWPWENVSGVSELPIEKVTSSADAVLILQPLVIGFVSSGPLSDYVPTMLVSARLIKRVSNEKLYSRNHESGSWNIAGDPKVIPAMPGFSNVNALLSDTKSAASALIELSNAIAESIADDLRR